MARRTEGQTVLSDDAVHMLVNSSRSIGEELGKNVVQIGKSAKAQAKLSEANIKRLLQHSSDNMAAIMAGLDKGQQALIQALVGVVQAMADKPEKEVEPVTFKISRDDQGRMDTVTVIPTVVTEIHETFHLD